ncbi:MAG: UvrD-helicase domain-containing protein, partial [Oscillospiraceae bacterium]|nr:UvrD-helicase domain-containing protein [Oscillospiraceae bacterium]
MMPNWTPEQKNAIEARGGALLVSAAAGSGKTAVLVERVLRLLTDKERPCGADELLIVTFTRAAAAQMRERIDHALRKRLESEPGNHALRRQQQLLPLAQICTIDKFCIRLVQAHGAAHGLPQNTRILDESEARLLQEEAADEALEAAYLADKDAFRLLGLLLEVSGDDGRLKALLQSASELALAAPNPDAWLAALPRAYDAALSPQASAWGKTQLAFLQDSLSQFKSFAKDSLRALEADTALRAKYAPALEDDIATFDRLLALAAQGAWDALRAQLCALSYARLSPKPKGSDAVLAESCKARRKLYTDKMARQKLAALLCVSEAEHREDMAALAPVAAAFAALAGDHLRICREKKASRGAAEFSDVLHWALDLLVTPEGRQTTLARELGAQFQEILVDEYQDVNAAQGKLFEALSRDGRGGNLFLVGDVKQSIYSFRQASPDLFLRMRREFSPFDGATYPACLVLGKNFRSRPGITDAVNFVFRQLMRADATEIEYTEEEELVCGAGFAPAQTPDTALHLLACDANAEDARRAEAAYIADLIAVEVAAGRRKARDFCILLRSAKTAGTVYAQALTAVGVPAYATETESLFQSREIQLLLALLKVTDNPVQDIPLAAVLLSPIVGFAPDDLARLHCEHRALPGLYQRVRAAANAGDGACARFLEQLAAWRRMAALCAPGDFVRWLLEETGLLALAGAMRQPARRRANLHRLTAYALAFSTHSGVSLPGFLRYLHRIEGSKSLTAVNTVSEAADVVRIMSIHKSKGLEFPVCILAQCAHGFNLSDLNGPLLLHPGAGLALQRPEPETRRRLRTLPAAALQTVMARGTRSEELRMLYVAMTRAREQLILLATEKNPDKRLNHLAARILPGQTQLPGVQEASS